MEKDDRGPCQVDYDCPGEIIQHFRDLINIGPMLNMDVDEVMSHFRIRLKKQGWSDKHICNFQRYATSTTVWEDRIPPKPLDRGNSIIAEDLKFRRS